MDTITFSRSGLYNRIVQKVTLFRWTALLGQSTTAAMSPTSGNACGVLTYISWRLWAVAYWHVCLFFGWESSSAGGLTWSLSLRFHARYHLLSFRDHIAIDIRDDSHLQIFHLHCEAFADFSAAPLHCRQRKTRYP